MFKKYESEVREILQGYLANEKVQSMKGYVQHGSVSTFMHCFNVALVSYWLVKTFNWKVAVTEMLVGALLHDFYLYDWHDGRKKPEGLHGFIHPAIAERNANKYFDLTEKESNIIYSHMFPLTIRKVPKSKEAVIVSLADKICATEETIQGFIERVS